MTKLAFLGTGNMGTGMARRLIAAGNEVRVYNRTPEKAAPLAEQGAVVAATPKDAAEGAKAVFAMVGDDEASKAVWLGETGALSASVAESAFIIECSTLSYGWVLELAEEQRFALHRLSSDWNSRRSRIRRTHPAGRRR